ERGQQHVGDVACLLEQHAFAGAQVPGQQAADHPDVRLEDLHRLRDGPEVEVVPDPGDAVGQFTVEAHEEQGVQSLHNGQSDRVGVVEELAEAAADREHLV